MAKHGLRKASNVKATPKKRKKKVVAKKKR